MAIIKNSPPVFLLHGIHTSETDFDFGEAFEDYFREAGFKTKSLYYGRIWAIQARWKNPKIVKQLWDEIPDGSILVAHSNGAALAYLMAKAGKKFAGVVLVNPALDKDKAIEGAGWVHVYHNEDDHVTWWSRWFIRSPWGAQGRDGPSFNLPHYKVFDCQKIKSLPKVRGHTAIYTVKANRIKYGPFMACQVKKELI